MSRPNRAAWFDDPDQLRGQARVNEDRARFWDDKGAPGYAATERNKARIFYARAQRIEAARTER